MVRLNPGTEQVSGIYLAGQFLKLSLSVLVSTMGIMTQPLAPVLGLCEPLTV